MRSLSRPRHQRGGSVNKPTSRVCVGWLLARALRLRYLRFLPPCLQLCVCWLCWLSARRTLSCVAPKSQFCVVMWPAVFTLLPELLLPRSVLFETETATGRSKYVSK
uniref:Uncharacterized protein n=1 Tax=Rhipicephalus pulchellus TaxID=72859 RepID=L7LVP7_RHIPC